jgi:hypothetical protein
MHIAQFVFVQSKIVQPSSIIPFWSILSPYLIETHVNNAITGEFFIEKNLPKEYDGMVNYSP